MTDVGYWGYKPKKKKKKRKKREKNLATNQNKAGAESDEKKITDGGKRKVTKKICWVQSVDECKISQVYDEPISKQSQMQISTQP